MKRTYIPALILAVLILGSAAPAAAQMSFELGFGWTFVSPAFNSTYVNSFAPPLTPSSDYISSSAFQTLKLNGKMALGMNGFFNFFINKHMGIQFLADYHRPKLGGTNSAYNLTLNYMTDAEQTYTKNDTTWPSTSGNFTTTTFSLNALFRVPVTDDLSISFSAGPSMFHIQGQASGMAYTSFNETYDASTYTYTVTGKTYKMVYKFAPQTKYGFNIGTEAAYNVYRNIILALDIRWFQSAKATSPLSLVASNVITESLTDIEAVLNLGSIRIDPSYFRAGAVIRFVF